MTETWAGKGSLLWYVLRSQARLIVPGTVLRANHQVMEALVPVVIGQVIDRAVDSSDADTLLLWLGILAVNFVFLSASYFYGARLVERGVAAAEHDIRVALARRVLRPTGGADGARLPGELLSIATSDAERVSWVGHVAAMAGGAIAALLVTTVVLLRISVPLGLLVLLGTVPLLLLIEFLGRLLQRHSDSEQEKAAYAAGLANDFVGGLRVLKGFGGATAAVSRYRDASRQSLGATVRAASTQAMYEGASLLLTGSFLALVALVGAQLAADGDISIGDLIAALGLTQFLIGPMYRLAFVGSGLARSRASAARVAAVLAAPEAVTDGTRSLPATGAGSLQLKDVRHAGLRGVSLDVAPGECIGIVTKDPADGDALIEVLSRNADPESGVILVDGVPMPEVALGDLRRRLLVSPHNAYLFSGSLQETVAAAAAGDVSREAVIAASALDDVIETLPGGLDAEISERGMALSGGQRQRLSLARALAAAPAILVLDEPTTAVDSLTENRIAHGLRHLRTGSTTVIVTTSPVLLAGTDRVVIIEDGRVTGESTHEQLMSESDHYQALVFA